MDLLNQNIKQILDLAEQTRRQIIETNIDYISLGQLPAEIAGKIEMFTDIEAVIFSALLKQQEVVAAEVPEKPALVRFDFENTSYMIFKNSLREPVSSLNIKKVSKTPANDIKPIQENNTDDLSLTQETKEDPVIQTDVAAHEDVLPNDEESSFKEPVTMHEEAQENEESDIKESGIDISSNDQIENGPEDLSSPELQPEFEVPKTSATIIGGEIKQNTQELPEIEKRVKVSDLVYDRFLISIERSLPDIKEEYTIVCAPMKLSRYKMLSTPIVVFIKDKHGHRFVKSSFDMEDGKNIVSMNIDDFSILIRGTFDENGNFGTIITTTGRSADKGDEISLISEEHYGKDRKNTKNGHPVMHYMSDEGLAYVFAIPIGEAKQEDFLVISKTEEFTDYMYSSSDTLGAYTAKVYENGVAKRVLPAFRNDELEIEVVEV